MNESEDELSEGEKFILEEDKIKITPELIFRIAIFIAIGIIVGATILIGYEIYQAKTSCENNLNGTYKLIFFTGEHLCNNKNIYRYNTGWNYDMTDINFSAI